MKWLLAAGAVWLLVTPFAHAALWGSPLYWALVFAAATATAWRFRRRRATAACAAALVLMLASMTPAGANGLLRLVEQPLTPDACQQESDRLHVLLTGGLASEPLDAGDYGALSQQSLARGVRFAQRFGAGDTREVLVSGGGPGVAEALPLAALLRASGVASQRIRVETASTTTWENARELKRVLPAPRSRIVLSTSALHMRRAALAFRIQGFDVCESPLYSDYVAPGRLGYYFPQSSALRKAEAALHELFGWLYYVGIRAGAA